MPETVHRDVVVPTDRIDPAVRASAIERAESEVS
ncbi:hypothetical protein BDK89_4069 [Ilumatobacter fluminis]|uniref:Uncharacterized protein n=1 Tax=Ilumatobacter fluminis TaxID=467091 RepID=A0A4R7I604_9ACTN|nr:hypothetical protein BDK89_4069 [Ilumatobacter fluminis]